MKAYQLLPRLRLLTLAGKNENGELEWIGTDSQWDKVRWHERVFEEFNYILYDK